MSELIKMYQNKVSVTIPIENRKQFEKVGYSVKKPKKSKSKQES